MERELLYALTQLVELLLAARDDTVNVKFTDLDRTRSVSLNLI